MKEVKDYFPKKIRDMVVDIIIEPDFDYEKNRSVQHYFVYLNDGQKFDATSIKDLVKKAKLLERV